MSTVSTAATIGTYTVAGGIAASTLSDAGEIVTDGHNTIRDNMIAPLAGPEHASEIYNNSKLMLTLASLGITQFAADNPQFRPAPKNGNPNVISNDSTYKEVNIHGGINTELDEVDLANKVIFEDKNASKLYMDNPDFPQTELQWAEKQILKKGRNRIEALKQSDFNLSSKFCSVLPPPEELKEIKKYVFRINMDTPELRDAVQIQLNELSELFPDYKFSAIYGGN